MIECGIVFVKTEDKLKIIHSYGMTKTYKVQLFNYRIVLISCNYTDNISAFGGSFDSSIDSLYDILKEDMDYAVKYIEL